MRIETLLKAKRGVYQNVHTEICREFQSKTIDDIRNSRDMILLTDENIIIKLRLPDKKFRLSKKDGYRLIYLVSKTKESVVFMDIYPKNGPLQQLDISDKDLTKMLEQLADEIQSGNIKEFEIEK